MRSGELPGRRGMRLPRDLLSCWCKKVGKEHLGFSNTAVVSRGPIASLQSLHTSARPCGLGHGGLWISRSASAARVLGRPDGERVCKQPTARAPRRPSFQHLNTRAAPACRGIDRPYCSRPTGRALAGGEWSAAINRCTTTAVFKSRGVLCLLSCTSKKVGPAEGACPAGQAPPLGKGNSPAGQARQATTSAPAGPATVPANRASPDAHPCRQPCSARRLRRRHWPSVPRSARAAVAASIPARAPGV